MRELNNCAALLSSPARRARQTVDIPVQSLPHCVVEDRDLRENNADHLDAEEARA